MLDILKSFSYAACGVRDALIFERNFRIQWLAGLLVVLINILVDFAAWEHAAMIIMSFLVLSLELHNCAIERLCDSTGTAFDINKKYAKDFAAAGVMVFSLAAATIFFVILEAHRSTIFLSLQQNPLPWINLVLIGLLSAPLCIAKTIKTVHLVLFALNVVATLMLLTFSFEKPLFVILTLAFLVAMMSALLAIYRASRVLRQSA